MFFFLRSSDTELEFGFVTTMTQVHRATGVSLRRLRTLRQVKVDIFNDWIIACGDLQTNKLKNHFR